MKRLRDLSLDEYIGQCQQRSTSSVLLTTRSGDRSWRTLSDTQRGVIEQNMRSLASLASKNKSDEALAHFDELAHMVAHCYGELGRERQVELRAQHKRLCLAAIPDDDDGDDAEESAELDVLLDRRLSLEQIKLSAQWHADHTKIQRYRVAMQAPRACVALPKLRQQPWHDTTLLDSGRQWEAALIAIGDVTLASVAARLCSALYMRVRESRPLWLALFFRTQAARAIRQYNLSALPYLDRLGAAALQQLVQLDWVAARARHRLALFTQRHALPPAYVDSKHALMLHVFLLPHLARRVRIKPGDALEGEFLALRASVIKARKALLRQLCLCFCDLHQKLQAFL
jgi:hypothetical protein